jgi:transcriptional regulator with XRE-family HTH domain
MCPKTWSRGKARKTASSSWGQGYNLDSSFRLGEAAMEIGKRLREVREGTCLSQGDISQRSGLTRSYISRVECGHGTPTIEVLERWSDALGVPIVQLFAAHGARVVAGGPQTGIRPSKQEKRFLALLERIDEPDWRLWFSLGLAIAKAQQAKR